VRTAVVTIAHGRHEHLRAQHASLAAGGRRPDHYVLVAMDDAELAPVTLDGLARDVVHVPAEPLGLPLARARNTGVRRALEAGAEVVVLLDVDCVAGPGLVAAYAEAVRRVPDAVWSGPVTYLPPPPPEGYDLGGLAALDAPHAARPDPGPGGAVLDTDPRLFWSLSFALGAEAWERTGGFCEDYVGYGGEDTDFGETVVRRGLRHAVTGDARAYHQWHPVSSPPVEHLDDVLRNGATFAARWGWWPMEGWLTAFEERGLVERTATGWARAGAGTRTP
jgi:GT2 family glycosyltransferase